MNSYLVVIVYTKDNQRLGTFVGAHTKIVISETAASARHRVQREWDEQYDWYDVNVTIVDVQVHKIMGDMIAAMYNSYWGDEV